MSADSKEETMITGIIGAMKVETDSLKSKVEGAVCEVVSGIEFVRGTLCGREVVIAQCGIGKVFAALCAQTMILRYGAEQIINTGVAGTLCEEIGILDIAVASSGRAISRSISSSSASKAACSFSKRSARFCARRASAASCLRLRYCSF